MWGEVAKEIVREKKKASAGSEEEYQSEKKLGIVLHMEQKCMWTVRR